MKLIPTRAAPAATTGKVTAIAQAGTAVSTAKPGTAAKATTAPSSGSSSSTTVSTKVPPQAATATAAAKSTASSDKMPKSGAGEDLLVWMLAALGLVGVLVVARRLRTSSN